MKKKILQPPAAKFHLTIHKILIGCLFDGLYYICQQINPIPQIKCLYPT